MKLQKYKCKRCLCEWIPRTEIPKRCPACGSKSWPDENKPKRGRPFASKRAPVEEAVNA